MVSSTGDRNGGHDDAALDEIELAGELMIAATASPGDRLPTERIDEVLLNGAVPRPAPEPAGPAAGVPSAGPGAGAPPGDPSA